MNIFNPFQKKGIITIESFAEGKVIRLENIPDQAFAHKLIGDGLALEINSLEIYAPCNGTIETIATTKHAFVLTLDNGAQLLIHIGLYQDKPYSEYFHYHVNTGDKITKGAHILTINQELLNMNNGKIIIPIVILNYKEHSVTAFSTASLTKAGKILFKVK